LAALSLGRMFGNVNRRPAIFAAQRETLQTAQDQQQHRCGDANRCKCRKETDCRGRATHQRNGDQEGIFAPDPVTQIAKHDRTQRANAEACTKDGKAGQHGRGRIVGREKQFPDQRAQYAVDEEIIPFEHRAKRRCRDHQPIALGIDHAFACLCCVRHGIPFPDLPVALS
jgi:hypothetical protein